MKSQASIEYLLVMSISIIVALMVVIGVLKIGNISSSMAEGEKKFLWRMIP